MFYISAEYFATGEGITLMLLVTSAATEKSALEQFKAHFDPFYLPYVEFHIKEQFIERFDHMLPSSVKKRINDKDDGYFTWQSSYYVNYS